MLEVKRVMPWILLEREKVAGGDGRALFHGYRVGSFHSRTGGQAVQEANDQVVLISEVFQMKFIR
jgi:hypothetical protein